MFCIPTKFRGRTIFFFVLALLLITTGVAQSGNKVKGPKAKFSKPVAFDVSPTLRDLAAAAGAKVLPGLSDDIREPREVRPERGPVVIDKGYSGDGALQNTIGRVAAKGELIPSPVANFEGMSNQDNFNVFGFRVNPPDPNGEVGLNHYVEMINLVFAVYSKTGTLLLGPVDTGTLWSGFPIEDCTDPQVIRSFFTINL